MNTNTKYMKKYVKEISVDRQKMRVVHEENDCDRQEMHNDRQEIDSDQTETDHDLQETGNVI